MFSKAKLTQERERIWQLDSEGLHACALTAIDDLLKHHPNDANALLAKGIFLYQLARYRDSEDTLHRAASLFDDESQHAVHRELGHLYSEWGRLEMALAAYQKVVELRPKHASGYIFAGAVLAKLGRFEDAIHMHSRGSQCAEGIVQEAHFNLGLILRAQERYSEARDCFKRTLEIDPQFARASVALEDVEQVLKSRSP